MKNNKNELRDLSQVSATVELDLVVVEGGHLRVSNPHAKERFWGHLNFPSRWTIPWPINCTLNHIAPPEGNTDDNGLRGQASPNKSTDRMGFLCRSPRVLSAQQILKPMRLPVL